jgi:hypothetical protein
MPVLGTNTITPTVLVFTDILSAAGEAVCPLAVRHPIQKVTNVHFAIGIDSLAETLGPGRQIVVALACRQIASLSDNGCVPKD